MIENIIFLLTNLFIEISNYILGYTVIFSKKLIKDKCRWILSIVGLIALHIFILKMSNITISVNLSVVTMFIIPLFILKQNDRGKYVLYPFITIGILSVSISMSYILAIVLGVAKSVIIENHSTLLICKCLPMILLIILAVVKKKKRNILQFINVSWIQYVLFILLAICIIFMFSTLEILWNKYNDTIINYFGVVVSIFCMIVVSVILWNLMVEDREQRFKIQNEVNEKYINLQKKYYEQLISGDEELRKFKHDFKFHMQMIRMYCENNSNDDLIKYIDNLIENSTIPSMKFYTENNEIDAMLRTLLSEASKKKITVDIKGKVKSKIKVTPYDLCTIVSNLLKNAIEACEQLENIDERKIYMEFAGYGSVFHMRISNTVNLKILKKFSNMHTSKFDKVNHGIGLINVRKTVSKYDGQIEFTYDDNSFSVEVNI